MHHDIHHKPMIWKNHTMNLDIAGILLSTDMFYALQQKVAGESYGSPLMWGVMLILQEIGIESVWHHRIPLFLASFNRNLHGWTYVSLYFRRYLISNRLLGGFKHVLFSPPYWWRMILESNLFSQNNSTNSYMTCHQEEDVLTAHGRVMARPQLITVVGYF